MAQAVAASIGFVIALTAAVYSSRNAQFQQKLHAFQGDMGRLNRGFGPLLSGLQDWLVEKFPREGGRDRPTPVASFMDDLGHLGDRLRQIPSADDPGDIMVEFPTLTPTVERLWAAVDWRDRQLALLQHTNPLAAQRRENEAKANIFGGFPTTYKVEVHNYLKEYPSGSIPPSQLAQARGWDTVFRQLKNELRSIQDRYGMDWLDERSQASVSVLRESFILFSIGVVVPMFFLISPPAWLFGPVLDFAKATWTPLISTLILAAEMTLLAVVLYRSMVLFRAVRTLIEEG